LSPGPVAEPGASALGEPSGVHQVLPERASDTGGVHAILPQPTVRIGRDEDNDVTVHDLLVSRHHAELRAQRDGGYELVDLGSRNGTFVNGRRVERARLQDLDVLSVGHHLFRLVGSQLEEYVDEGRISFEVNGLTVRAAPGKVLLDDVGFALDERSFVAVLGPSGSGKSTLLNALTGFKQATEGTVLYGGRDLYAEYDELRARIGFVPQDDIVHAALTIREALGYAARLRFPSDVPAADLARRVEEIAEELGLAARADVPIDRLSGGQRRRVSVGLELIAQPSLLFLDEPTSGLDPGYERSLMELLRGLADDGRTVVVVTHSVQSLRLCDRVMFLAPGGHVAYFGPPQFAAAYFGCDDLQKAFQQLSTGDGADWGRRFRESPYHADYVVRASHDESAPIAAPARERRPRERPREWLSQFGMLTRRYARVMASDRRNLALTLAQPPLLGLLMLAALPAGELTAPASGDVRVVSRAGLVLLVVVLGMTWLGASNAIREVVKELPIYRRERAVGLSVSAYVASKVTVLGALTILQAAVLIPIALARQGSPAGGSLIGWPLLELIAAGALAGLASMGLALLISSLAGTVDRAMTVLPLVLVLQMLLAMGGLFPDLIDKPVLKQASYVSSAQWGFSAMASTVDLERLDAINHAARGLPDVRLEDPTPVLSALAEPPASDYRWRHSGGSWLFDAGMLLAIAALATGGGAVALSRKRPEA
jgi:ABC-type multidrug transport system ATPase subunit